MKALNLSSTLAMLCLISLFVVSCGASVPLSPTRTAVPSPVPPTAEAELPAVNVSSADAVPAEFGDFSAGCKIAGDTADGTFACENGEYTILNKVPDRPMWMYLGGYYTDAIVEVDARQLAGTTQVSYGIIFRRSPDGNNFYYFCITRRGYFALLYNDPTEWKKIIPFTTSSALKLDAETNRLKVITQGDQIALFANGQLLRVVTDNIRSAGQAGVMLAGDAANGKVAFRNLSIAKIVRPITLPAPSTNAK